MKKLKLEKVSRFRWGRVLIHVACLVISHNHLRFHCAGIARNIMGK